MLERWEHSCANYQTTPPLIQHFVLSERLVLTLDYGRGRLVFSTYTGPKSALLCFVSITDCLN